MIIKKVVMRDPDGDRANALLSLRHSLCPHPPPPDGEDYGGAACLEME
jgi:hypothetical protein